MPPAPTPTPPCPSTFPTCPHPSTLPRWAVTVHPGRMRCHNASWQWHCGRSLLKEVSEACHSRVLQITRRLLGLAAACGYILAVSIGIADAIPHVGCLGKLSSSLIPLAFSFGLRREANSQTSSKVQLSPNLKTPLRTPIPGSQPLTLTLTV